MIWNVLLISEESRLYAVFCNGEMRGLVAGDRAKVSAYVQKLKAGAEG